MKKRELTAFVTVEYTMLLPVLMMMYAFLIYIGLFMYNRCILQANAYLLSTECVESIEEKGTRKIEQIEKQKILLAEDIVYQFSMRQNKMYITGSANMENPFFKAGIGKEHWALRVYSEVDAINPVNTLRLCKAAAKVLEKVMEEEENANESATGIY